jgi:hypothetical protein
MMHMKHFGDLSFAHTALICVLSDFSWVGERGFGGGGGGGIPEGDLVQTTYC